MRKIKVAVLMGGKTPEHEISLITGREVVRNLNKSKYKVLPVVISRTGERWQSLAPRKLLSLPNPLSMKGTKKDLVSRKEKQIQGVNQLLQDKLNVIFIAMHGPFGEDGTVQGMLELAGIPYTGPGVLASALGMDKIMFKKVLQSQKIPVPKFVVFEKGEPFKRKVLGKPPYFIKPHNQGSSVGASIAKTKKSLRKALNLAFKYSDLALVEEYIKGTEVTCGVIGNKNPKPLPLVEIVPKKSEFFDYESKYTESGAEEIVPARISARLTKKVQKMALDVYKVIGCRGFSRVDFILRDGKKPIVLEINTIPGLTPMSLVPKAAKAAGISYSQLLDKIISYAIEN
jgi:D-alanine-D-alanine ligase